MFIFTPILEEMIQIDERTSIYFSDGVRNHHLEQRVQPSFILREDLGRQQFAGVFGKRGMRYTRWRFLKDSLLEFSFTEMFREMIQFKMQKYIFFFGFRWQKHLLSWTSRVIHPSFLGIPMSFPRMFLLFGPRSPIQSLKSITIWKLQLHPFKFFLSKWIFIHPMQLEFCQPNKFRKTWFFSFGDVSGTLALSQKNQWRWTTCRLELNPRC